MFCIPIIAKDTEEAIRKMAEAGRLADVLEIRLDLMDSFDVKAIVSAAGKPVLITYRSVNEGGKGDAGPEKSAGYLISAIEAGADFVDLELTTPPEIRGRILRRAGKTKIVVSTHITSGTPSGDELEKIYTSSIAAGGDIIKIVTMAGKWEDNLGILELVSRAKKDGIRIISFCMGPLGRMSRVFSLFLGACMTFASLEPGQESANGQISIDKMKEITGFFST
jgi:3-dehydroquinate dehydratase type I